MTRQYVEQREGGYYVAGSRVSLGFQDAEHGGVIGVPNPRVLVRAADSARILVSPDQKTMPGHFSEFLQDRSSPGLTLVPQNLDIGQAIEDLLVIWAASDADEWRDRIYYLPL